MHLSSNTILLRQQGGYYNLLQFAIEESGSPLVHYASLMSSSASLEVTKTWHSIKTLTKDTTFSTKHRHSAKLLSDLLEISEEYAL